MTQRFVHTVCLLGVFVLSLSTIVSAQTITHAPDTRKSLKDRWSWAQSEAKSKDYDRGYWIGYSIERSMGKSSFIGSFYSDRRRNHPTLGELLTGIKQIDDEIPERNLKGFTSMSGTMNLSDDKHEQKVKKEVAIIFHYTKPGSQEFDEIKVSNLSLNVDFDGDPLLWLGMADYSESVSFLSSSYTNARSTDAKERFIMTMGLHEESPEAMKFLENILKGKEHSDVREEAAFWLGQTDKEEARKILLDVAQNDHSEDVREKAIFSISQMDGETSTEALISLAKNHRDKETRKNAAFWLGQRASDKVLGALKDIAYHDEDSDVQKSALFALTQMENSEGVDELIKIARSHPNPKLRKDAVFWLGQSEDPRALDALIDIVRK